VRIDEDIVFLNEFGPAFSEAELETVRRIGELLKSAGFCEAETLGVLGVPAFKPPRESNRLMPEFLRRTSGGSGLETLIRLFILRQAVPVEAARRAVAPMDLADWRRLGLIAVDGGAAKAAVELCLYGDVIAAADWPGGASGYTKQVMGLAASSRALIQMTIRRTAERAFDLGIGCGIQALLAARHTGRVVAADLNRRAVRYAEFNALLNGTGNISFATGSLFGPVEDQKFDLIVCNPPFVIGPRVLYTHTTSGEPSDHFCEAIVRGAPAHLSENGYAQIVCNWAQVGDETSREHVGRWFESSGCDAWVLHSHAESAENYARARAEENAPGPDGVDALYGEWMDYFNRENIVAVNFGVITMRRSSKLSNWVRYDELPGVNGFCGKSIELGFLLRDFLETHRDDRQLLKTCFKCAPDLTLLTGQTDMLRSKKTNARLEHGLTFAAALDPDVAEFVCSCKGNAPLQAYVRKLSARKHIPMSYLLPSFLVVVRHLIELGFLLPMDILSRLDQ